MSYEGDYRKQLLTIRYLSLLDRFRMLQKKKAEMVAGTSRRPAGSPRIKRRVYLLRHPDSGFSGSSGAIDFSQGRGSTSSLADRDLAVDVLGCVDISDEIEAPTASGDKAAISAAQIGGGE